MQIFEAGSEALGPSDVITGLVPVLPIVLSAAPFSIGTAGPRPAMTGEEDATRSLLTEGLCALGSGFRWIVEERQDGRIRHVPKSTVAG
ncbi:hypothetical protein J4G37_16915 [Microvirga sp. 3-52]|nr:hypothetical protein [Microvirga sp. 3-52]